MVKNGWGASHASPKKFDRVTQAGRTIDYQCHQGGIDSTRKILTSLMGFRFLIRQQIYHIDIPLRVVVGRYLLPQFGVGLPHGGRPQLLEVRARGGELLPQRVRGRGLARNVRKHALQACDLLRLASLQRAKRGGQSGRGGVAERRGTVNGARRNAIWSKLRRIRE